MAELGTHAEVRVQADFIERDAEGAVTNRCEATFFWRSVPKVGAPIDHPHRAEAWIIRRVAPLRLQQDCIKGYFRSAFAVLATPPTDDDVTYED